MLAGDDGGGDERGLARHRHAGAFQPDHQEHGQVAVGGDEFIQMMQQRHRQFPRQSFARKFLPDFREPVSRLALARTLRLAGRIAASATPVKPSDKSLAVRMPPKEAFTSREAQAK